jgi:hypothetical protein
MNCNIILNIIIFNKSKLFKIDNYWFKLLNIKYFKNYYLKIKLENYYLIYRTAFILNKINCKSDNIFDETGLFINGDETGLFINGFGKLGFIPNEIGLLYKLKTLGIRSMNFKIWFLPNEIGNLINLKKIYISNEKIKILPKTIGNLINLEVLHLSDNKLRFIPSTIGNLIRLRSLTLERNPLEYLVSELGNLVNLEYFTLNASNANLIGKELKKIIINNHCLIYDYKN